CSSSRTATSPGAASIPTAGCAERGGTVVRGSGLADCRRGPERPRLHLRPGGAAGRLPAPCPPCRPHALAPAARLEAALAPHRPRRRPVADGRGTGAAVACRGCRGARRPRQRGATRLAVAPCRQAYLPACAFI